MKHRLPIIHTTPPEPHQHGHRVPTLRVRKRHGIWHVRYECRDCEHVGGLALSEADAKEMWP